MADLEDIGVLVEAWSTFPLARNSRGLNRTTNPVGGILVSSDVNLPFPEDLKTISGTVVGADGLPAVRTIIATNGTGKLTIRTQSDANGSFSMPVPAGLYRVVATGEPGLNDLVFANVEPDH